ncbi:MAG: hypothetical protein LBJ18_03865, partial [Rickettsiales bacterium]|nr:hypothetical protein [Rickettsiales bacterium]
MVKIKNCSLPTKPTAPRDKSAAGLQRRGTLFYLQTFGCQMNVYDGQRIDAMLRARGWTPTDNIADAD